MPTPLATLVALLPPQRVATDHATLAVHDSDAQTAYRCRGLAVVTPATTEEAITVVRWCAEHRVPFVVRGSGTGLSAGATPVENGIVIVTTRLNRIKTLDPVRRLAVVEAGVVNQAISTAALPQGLFYAPDPSSQPICTIGGNVGFNAGGAHCLKHGMTSNHVLGLKAVLATGEVVQWGGFSRETIEPDWTGLFVGNEGLFGMALEVTVNLKTLPETRHTVLAGFVDSEAAGHAVSAIIAAGIVPVAMELMDALTIEAVKPVVPIKYPPNCGALLVIELDGPRAVIAAEQIRLAETLDANATTGVLVAVDEKTRSDIWRVRKSAYSAYGRLAPNNFVQDSVVPRRKLGEALRRIEQIAAEANLICANVCHAGDGNLHPNLLYDGSEPGKFEIVERVAGEILSLCVELGGSITGEHGVGAEKRAFLPKMFGPPEMDLFHRLHEAFDPHKIANPGKMLEPAVIRLNSPVAPETNANSATSLPAPTSIAELANLVKQHPRLLPVGNRTKPALSTTATSHVSLRKLTGITAYEPTEFVLTALAGTPLREIEHQLALNQQCLPFDPLFVAAGASLGGTVAAGLNGPARFSRGGLRDAVIGLTFIDGNGQPLTVGSRVVKNVAGFDLPKFLVGSLGRFGILTEITIKVSPRPEATRTLEIQVDDTAALVAQIHRLATSPTEPEAIDARPLENRIYVRFAARAEAIDNLIEPVLNLAAATLLAPSTAETFWTDTTNFAWAHPDGNWIKIPVTLESLPEFLTIVASAADARLHVSAAGDLAYLSLPPENSTTRNRLTQAGYPSLLFRGEGPIRSGTVPASPITQRVRSVMDPHHKFS
jgi:glycolate oxidase